MSTITDQISGNGDPVFPLVVNSKLDATADPTVNDDSADGYSVGSLWVNVSTDAAWVLTDATVGAAQWQAIVSPGPTGATGGTGATGATGASGVPGTGAALSVLGRSANSSGDRADIAAADNAMILRTVANALGFGYFSDFLDAVYGATDGLLVRDTSWVLKSKGAARSFLQLEPRNALINGAFNVAQRGTTFTDSGSANNDDTYNLDRWYLLSDGNDVVDVSQDTADVPTNGLYAAKMLVVTVNKKFGLAQIIEQKNCIGLIGETVTLSFKAKVNNTTRLDKIKAGIIAWSGTADTVTSDIVSAWGTDGTTPTLIANATFENTPADLGVTTSWAEYSVSAAVDTASTKNILVFIWSDNVTDTDASDTLSIADVQLEYGATATRFERRPYGQELLSCRRYFWRALSGSGVFVNTAQALSATQFFSSLFYPTEMRIAPTVSVADQTHFEVFDASGGSITTTALTFATTFVGSMRIDGTTASGLVAGDATMLRSANASARMDLTAEL